jgi:hypothetical protein
MFGMRAVVCNGATPWANHGVAIRRRGHPVNQDCPTIDHLRALPKAEMHVRLEDRRWMTPYQPFTNGG